MTLIPITLECHPSDSDIPEGLREDIEEESEWRKGYVESEYIVFVYPHSSKDRTVIEMANGGTYGIKESIEYILEKTKTKI